MNIQEDYVSFEIAKLLKEKGFNIACEYQYINCSSEHPFLTDIRDDADCYYKNTEIGQDEYSAPTLQMAMKWLREVHNIYMDISPTHSPNEPIHFIWQTYNSDYLVTGDCDIFYPTYEKACEAAIKYCLENLI